MIVSTDHIERALYKLTERFRGKPVMSAFLTALIRQVQRLELGAAEVIERRINPIGVGIDHRGSIVGRGRNGMSDADFLRAIAAQQLANRSGGQSDTLLRIFVLSTPEGTSFDYLEGTYAAIRFTAHGPINAQVVYSLLRRAKAGGVRLVLSWSPSGDPANDFAFAGPSPGQGFANSARTIGGRFRAVLSTS